MREYIQKNPNRWADQIRLRRDAFAGVFLVVEGHSDKLVYGNFVNSKTCEFVISDGKEQALNTIKILDNDKFTGVLAVVDADFDHLENNLPNTPNILLTDDHDLEMMMLKTNAFDKLINERGSEEKIKNKNIRKILLELGQEIGYLRWVSQKNNLSLRFKDLNFDKFIDKKTLTLCHEKLIHTIKNNSKNLSLADLSLVDKKIQENIESLKNDQHDAWQVCCGHDIMNILSLSFRNAWGSWDRVEVKTEILEMELRLAYETAYFDQTQLYISIQNWQKINSHYQILKE